MQRWIFELRRDAPAKLIALGVVVLSVPFVAVHLMSQYSVQSEKAPEQIGVDANATRVKLRDLSAVLVTADKRGDVQLAKEVRLQVFGVDTTLSYQPQEKQFVLRMCRLAAKHLITGAESIIAGGRWNNEDQFHTAASDCRD